jgi:uncharacterized membrane protein YqjE
MNALFTLAICLTVLLVLPVWTSTRLNAFFAMHLFYVSDCAWLGRTVRRLSGEMA